VLKAERLSSKQQPAKASDVENTKPVTSSTSVNSSHNDVMTSGVSEQSSKPGASQLPAARRPALPACPYKVVEICDRCWTRSNSREVVYKSTKANQCSKDGHPWIGVSFLILPCKKLLANLPPTIPRNLNFTICWDLTTSKRCRHGGKCTFAHCQEEIAVWKWMVQNNG